MTSRVVFKHPADKINYVDTRTIINGINSLYGSQDIRYRLSEYQLPPGVLMAADKFLDLPPAAQRDKTAFEVLRVWIAEQGQHVSIRSGAWEDPFAWGIVLADLARHIAHAPQLQHDGTDTDAF